MSGFGKHSGPTSAPKSANPFQFQRPPPPSTTPPISPMRLNEAVDRVRPPSSTSEYSGPAVRPYQYGGVQRPSFRSQMPHNPVKSPATCPSFPTHQDRSVVSPHLGSPDYSKNFVKVMPDMQPPKQGKLPLEQFDDKFTQEHPMFSRNGSKRPMGSPPRLGTKSTSPSSNVPIHPRSLPSAGNDPSPVVRNIGPPVSKRTRSPPLIYSDDFLQDNSTPIEVRNIGPSVSKRTRSPSIYKDEFLQDSSTPTEVRNIGPSVSKRTRSPSIYKDEFLQDSSTPTEVRNIGPSVYKRMRSPSIYKDEFLQDNSTTSDAQNIGPSISKRTRSPPLIYDDEFLQDNSAPTEVRNIGPSISKRTRSPPSTNRDEFLQDNSTPIEDDTERELQAKAKRLARFKTELREPVQTNPPDFANQRSSTTRFQHNVEEKKKHVGEQSMDSYGEFLNDTVLSDFGGTEASRLIIGLCPDMCPGMFVDS